MAGLCWTLISLNALIFLVWLTRHIEIFIERKYRPVLTPKSPGPPENPPMLSVVIAAKDEQATIEQCVTTMLSQDYPNFEIVVCNDRSSDDTLAILQKIAAADPRLRVLDVKELPEGWLGKTNAMQQGINFARGEYILMVDADCRQISDRTLSVTMQHVIANTIDMFSIISMLEMKTFWEKAAQPVCGGIMMIWFKPDKVNNPAKPHAYANGAFMLMSRKAWQEIGTHESVRNCLNEDIHLARLVKEKGMNLKIIRSEGLFLSRMYTSLAEIIRGWTRIFYGTFQSYGKLVGTFLMLFIMSLLPYLAAIGTGVALALLPENRLMQLAFIASAAAAIMQLSVIYRFYKLAGANPLNAWMYPLGSCVAILAVIKAFGKRRSGAQVTWRGTSYVSSLTAKSPDAK